MTSATTSRVVDLDGRRLLLTNLDLPIWSDDPLTKEDLLRYHLSIADQILPFLRQRPLSLMRCPGGAGTDWVFQKTAPPGLPSWVASRRIRGERTAVGYADYVVGSDRVALAHLVNIGAVSFHPWNCTVDAVDRPDQLLFDVDPTDIAFREVRIAALLIRDLLARHKIRSWVKTSGGRGLHVMVPLAPNHTFDEVLTAAAAISRQARTREPSLFSFDMRRARRRGKILIDIHRNHRGATLISPYSVRHDTTQVSAPLAWAELEKPIYPEDFHLRNIQERIGQVGNPFEGLLESPQSLTLLLERTRARRGRRMA